MGGTRRGRTQRDRHLKGGLGWGGRVLRGKHRSLDRTSWALGVGGGLHHHHWALTSFLPLLWGPAGLRGKVGGGAERQPLVIPAGVQPQTSPAHPPLGPRPQEKP